MCSRQGREDVKRREKGKVVGWWNPSVIASLGYDGRHLGLLRGLARGLALGWAPVWELSRGQARAREPALPRQRSQEEKCRSNEEKGHSGDDKRK